MRAIVLHSLDKTPVVEEVENPQAKAGQVVVEIIGTDLSPNTKQILTGALPFKPSAFPCIPGGSAVGRVHELGSDATTLQVGQLVFASLVTRARDNPEIEILQGVGTALTPSAHKLTSGDYRNGALAEFAAFPIENIVPLDEEALASVGLGSDRYADLLSLTPALVAMGGLAELDVKAGDTLLCIPSLGQCGSASVRVGLALGANVVVVARNEERLKELAVDLQAGNALKTVVLIGDVEKDAANIRAATKGVGATHCLDFTPLGVPHDSYIQAALQAMAFKGKVVLMGFPLGVVSMPYLLILRLSLQIAGKFMYRQDDARRLFKLVESGKLTLPWRSTLFGLDDFWTAAEAAEQTRSWKQSVVVTPQQAGKGAV